MTTCCSCSDKRPQLREYSYPEYRDGLGFTDTAPRNAGYCPICKRGNSCTYLHLSGSGVPAEDIIANTTASFEAAGSVFGCLQPSNGRLASSSTDAASVNTFKTARPLIRTKRTKDKKTKNTFSFSSDKGVTFSSVSASSVSAGTCKILDLL
jgi:hypothetical protein